MHRQYYRHLDTMSVIKILILIKTIRKIEIHIYITYLLIIRLNLPNVKKYVKSNKKAAAILPDSHSANVLHTVDLSPK